MNDYEIKKIISVDGNLSLEECEKLFNSEEVCLGILDENREISSYVLKEDLLRVLRFNLNNCPVNLIATSAKRLNLNINNPDINKLQQYIRPGLNKGVFIGKNKQTIENLIVCKDFCFEKPEKYLINEFESNLPEKVKKALYFCSQAADKISLPIFLIGGVVRDIIIGKSSFDIDIAVQESAIDFSRYLKREYSNIVKIKEIHEEFKTTKVIFTIDNEEIELDIASTRKENYLYPANLPQVKEIGCDIKEDISRRDFTINSMALSLNKSCFCRLVDPLNGYDDIIERKIRILHPISFIDDPTRIIRALKFSIRFNYKVEKATINLEENCINSHLFNNLGGERIKSEIKQTFNLNKAECLRKFIHDKLYLLVNKNISIPENYPVLAKKTQKIVNSYQKFVSQGLIWLIYLEALLINTSTEETTLSAEKLYLSGLETEILLGSKGVLGKLDQLKQAKTRFEIYELLENYFSEAILVGLIHNEDKEVKSKIDLYLKQLQNINIYTTGKDLINAGLSPGPIFGEILRELLQAKINQKISTKEDEEKYIKKFIPKKYRK